MAHLLCDIALIYYTNKFRYLPSTVRLIYVHNELSTKRKENECLYALLICLTLCVMGSSFRLLPEFTKKKKLQELW